MTVTASNVLKKHRVRTGAGGCVALAPEASRPAPGGPAPQVRIAEQHPDRAVLEVRCACGSLTYVECRWKVPAPGGGAAPQPAAP